MTVQARFISGDLGGRLRDGAYELPDGATVKSLIEAARAEAGIDLTEQQMDNFVLVYDNSPAGFDTILSDGGKLRVMFKILGG